MERAKVVGSLWKENTAAKPEALSLPIHVIGFGNA